MTVLNRRLFLKLLVAAAAIRRVKAAGALHIVVAGAGIIGASIAWHLAKAGAKVTVIDRQGPATHASRGSFAWINATWSKQPHGYHALNQDGVGRWRALQPKLSLPVRWGGSFEGSVDPARDAELASRVAEQVLWGESTRLVELADLSDLEPNVEFSGLSQVIYSANDGATDPVAATRAFLDAAAALGARVRYPCELTDVTLSGGRVVAVETSCGEIPADRLVLATGASVDAGRRFADWDVPQRDSPGITAVTTPMPRLIQRVLWMPGVHLHQRDDGRIILGEEEGAPQNAAHIERLAHHPNVFPARDIALQHAEQLRAAAQRYLPGLARATFEDAMICWRPMPLDGYPVLGASPARRDVYIAVTHSGVTLAPIVGELAALEIIEDASIERLREFRPGRTVAPGA